MFKFKSPILFSIFYISHVFCFIFLSLFWFLLYWWVFIIPFSPFAYLEITSKNNSGTCLLRWFSFPQYMPLLLYVLMLCILNIPHLVIVILYGWYLLIFNHIFILSLLFVLSLISRFPSEIIFLLSEEHSLVCPSTVNVLVTILSVFVYMQFVWDFLKLVLLIDFFFLNITF